jgi:hypothetical protein
MVLIVDSAQLLLRAAADARCDARGAWRARAAQRIERPGSCVQGCVHVAAIVHCSSRLAHPHTLGPWLKTTAVQPYVQTYS